MSKKARNQQKQRSVQHKGQSRRKVVVVAGLILCLGLTTLILAQWRAMRVAIRTNASLAPAAPPPQANPTPTLSKEYIYAGGRLIATEEPTSTSTNGPAPTGLLATATSGTTVSLTWTAPTGTINSYQVERSQSINGPYTPLSPNPQTTSFTDTTASGGIAYLYQVKAIYTGGGSSTYSNKDLATTIIFTDDPLNPTGTKTIIQAQHLIDLRQAVNAVRALAGLSSASWTYPDPVSGPPSQRRQIYLEDITDLRSKLDDALTILGMSQPYPSSPPLARGSAVSAAHFTQIRDRVK
jgi:hypothetical protein